MIYGEQHSWQNSNAVQQVLVFETEQDKAKFDLEFANVVARDSIYNASENNLGAAYKLRAVLESNDEWRPLIRDPFTGGLLVEHRNTFATAEEALEQCKLFASDLKLCQLQKKIKNMDRKNNPWMPTFYFIKGY